MSARSRPIRPRSIISPATTWRGWKTRRISKVFAPPADVADAVKEFLVFVKTTLGDAVAEVRASERLTDSAVCLVAPDSGPDRALERILAGAGRLNSASKPILEINPRHETVAALAALGDSEREFRQDAVALLFDEARVLDGERPADARLFSERLARV